MRTPIMFTEIYSALGMPLEGNPEDAFFISSDGHVLPMQRVIMRNFSTKHIGRIIDEHVEADGVSCQPRSHQLFC